ncbi:MAG: PKD domain-containing protein [Flavobacteriales bacterium]
MVQVNAHSPGQGVRFTKNMGQWDMRVHYRAPVHGATVFFEAGGLTWSKYADEVHEIVHHASEMSVEERSSLVLQGHAWHMGFYQQATPTMVQAEEALPGYENYFIGADRSRWRGHVKAFGSLVYRNVWPGVDIRYHSVGGDLKYDILVEAGADPGRIGFNFAGIQGARVDDQGRFVIKTSVGDVVEMAPVAFYADDKAPVHCSFQWHEGVLGFDLPDDLDRTRPLIIDPLLIASTLSGATGDDNYGHCATYDDEGNIYTGARNFGPTYPATLGAFQTTMGGGGTDMSFSKYDPDGSTLIWASYLGGSGGENPHSMIVNTAGELCVMGTSNSTDFPLSQNAFDEELGGTDITVTHFSQDGATLIGSTFLGGADQDGLNGMFGNYGEAYRGEIFLDGNDNILLATCSSSSDFPTTPGCFQSALAGQQDGVVVKLSPDCSTLLFSTFIGGSANDNVMGIRLAVNGDILITGSTESTDHPVGSAGAQSTFIGGARDGYVFRLTGDASTLIAGTFFGTTESDRPYFIDTDLNDDVWIYGQSEGSMPITPTGTFGVQDGPIFVSKLAADLSSVLVSTTIGGTAGWNGAGGTVPVAFLVDVCGNIYISGYNSSDGLPTTADALYTDNSFYLAAFEPEMTALIFGTYYGGSHVDGGTSRFDKNGIVYQGVCSGMGSLQTTPGAWATSQSISWDVGVFKIDFGTAGVNAAGASAVNTGCAPIQVDFSNASSGDTWLWDFGDGSPEVEAFEPSHLYTEPGEYSVRLIAMDSLSCNLADTVFFDITIGAQQPVAAALTWEQIEDCTQLLINAQNQSTGDPLDHVWQLSDGAEYQGDSISHVFDEEGQYTVTLIAFDPTGCSTSDTITTVVDVAPFNFEFDLEDRRLCEEWSSLELDASAMEGDFLWSTGDTTPVVAVEEVGSYWVTVTLAGGCSGTDTVEVLPPNVRELAISSTVCPGEETELTIPLGDALSYDWGELGATRTIRVPGEAMSYGFTVIDADGCFYADSAKVTLYDSEVQLFAPNAFSPNDDGFNDTFQLFGYGERAVDLSIYDRWGEQVYWTDRSLRPWDGSYNGTAVPNDLYVYVLRYTGICTGQKETQRVGHVTVIR